MRQTAELRPPCYPRRPSRLKCTLLYLALTLALVAALPTGGFAKDTVVGHVIFVEDDIVTILLKSEIALKIGERLEVLNYDDVSVAVVKIESIKRKTELTCRRLSGEDYIIEGYTAKTRRPLEWALYAEYVGLPTKTKFGSDYATLTNTPLGTPSTGAFAIYFGGITKIGKLLEGWTDAPILIQLSTAYFDLKAIKAWEFIDIGPTFRIEFVPEKFRLELTGGAGIGAGITQVKWARPDGTYNDLIGRNVGEADYHLIGVLRGSAGLHLQLSRTFGLFVRAAYYNLHFNTPQDTSAPTESSPGNGEYDIQDEWMEEYISESDGVAISSGLQFWFML